MSTVRRKTRSSGTHPSELGCPTQKTLYFNHFLHSHVSFVLNYVIFSHVAAFTTVVKRPCCTALLAYHSGFGTVQKCSTYIPIFKKIRENKNTRQLSTKIIRQSCAHLWTSLAYLMGNESHIWENHWTFFFFNFYMWNNINPILQYFTFRSL